MQCSNVPKIIFTESIFESEIGSRPQYSQPTDQTAHFLNSFCFIIGTYQLTKNSNNEATRLVSLKKCENECNLELALFKPIVRINCSYIIFKTYLKIHSKINTVTCKCSS